MTEISPDEQDPRIQLREKMKHLSPERQKAINDAVFAMQNSLAEMEIHGADPFITTQVAELGVKLGDTVFVDSTAPDKLSFRTQQNISGLLEMVNTGLESHFLTGAWQPAINPERVSRLERGLNVVRSHVGHREADGTTTIQRRTDENQSANETTITR